MEKKTKSTVRIIVSYLLVISSLITALEIRDILKWFGIKVPGFPIAYGGAILDNLLAVITVVVVAFLLMPKKQTNIAPSLGIRWTGLSGPLLALIATLPCWVGFAMRGKLIQDIDVVGFIYLSIVFPLAEEIVFRGFGFIYLRQKLRWRLAPSLFFQAFVFGWIHWLGAGGGGIALQVFLITFFGSILFAILDSIDNYTIWSGFVFHASLNAVWSFFEISDTAATDWIGNLLRFACSILAVVFFKFFVQPNKDKKLIY